jgi:photosystem II stability/assembly factor-like uncharacterized protein
MPARLVVAVGTRKGLFVLEGSAGARRLELRGPFFPGAGVNAALIDRRGSPRILAGANSPWFGMTIQTSRDLGRTWKETKAAPAFTKEDGRTLANIWSLAPGREKNEYLCGVEPAALFRSRDAGESWEKVPGLTDHPHARTWSPGGGGLCLHTILERGGTLHVGISTGGHYASHDGTESFAPENQGVPAHFMPQPFPEYGQCVHKIAGHPSMPERLYMQNHGGFPDHPDASVLRSDDGGKSWKSIAKGLPSDFGFPIAVHPDDPDVAYVVPLSGETRTCPEAKPAVWRTENGGGSWQRLVKGLPKKEAWFTVLRDAMELDDSRRPSVWFGTTTGQVWRGREGGDEWECVAGALPPVTCVKVAVV